MKYFKILTILVFSSVITFSGCKDDTPEPIKETRVPLQVFDAPTQQNATTANSTTPTARQNAGSLYHYTCSNGCAGGAGVAGNCSTCGNPLAHNQAFHNNTPTTAPSTTPPIPEPSQNTAGVWHYSCGKGCAGGSGAAGNCSTCNGALTHNTAYHQ